MIETLEFDVVHYYDLKAVGIPLDVTLIFGGKTSEFVAKIDTGSTFCVFRRSHGELLGLDIENGIPADLATATGRFRAYGHELTLSVLGVETVSTVYFAEEEYFNRNVLGRIGWLDRVKLGLIDQEGKLFLSKYRK
jgi:predicted aspartyl protease